MKQPSIIIVHRLQERIRVKLSHPLRDTKAAITLIKEGDGIEYIQYNSITKSILVKFNNLKIEVEEVVIRIAIAYSKQYDFVPIKLVSSTPKRDMPSLANYSVVSILAAAATKFLGINATDNLEEFINWITVGTTMGAIVEHGYKEINEKGAFDPEVVSIMYLINSISKGNFIMASAITWIATFGRHILDFYYEGITIKINAFKNTYTKEECYDVAISPYDNVGKKVDFLQTFAKNFIANQDFGGNANINVFRNKCQKINFNRGLVKGFI